MARGTNIYEALNKWYQNNLGQLVLQVEQYELDKVLPTCFGYHLLQLGGPHEKGWLASSPIKHHIHYAEVLPNPTPKSAVCGDFADLPFLPDSIDVVLIPHLLELIDNPQQVLKASVDVLIADGHIIILGFNPFSLWGMWWLARHKRDQIPWVGQFRRIGQIRHWLAALDCEIDTLETYFFRPPLADLEQRKQLRIFETIGQSCWPWLGGLYIISARKHVKGVNPLKLRALKPHFISNKGIVTSGSMERDKTC